MFNAALNFNKQKHKEKLSSFLKQKALSRKILKMTFTNNLSYLT